MPLPEGEGGQPAGQATGRQRPCARGAGGPAERWVSKPTRWEICQMATSALNKSKGGVSVPGMGRRSPTWRTEGAESLQGRPELRHKMGSAGGGLHFTEEETGSQRGSEAVPGDAADGGWAGIKSWPEDFNLLS